MVGADDTYGGKLLGFVQVDVAGRSFTLPVQALDFTRDARDGDDGRLSGGFFAEAGGSLGILVDARASEDEVRQQIQAATEEAIRHLSRRYLS
ncbi:MAG: hypothetical protein JNL38_06350 [Myxococcales bacterium]|jgi:hypothetical protein|nr:hypothetical protein [Myxococcales bacterium]